MLWTQVSAYMTYLCWGFTQFFYVSYFIIVFLYFIFWRCLSSEDGVNTLWTWYIQIIIKQSSSFCLPKDQMIKWYLPHRLNTRTMTEMNTFNTFACLMLAQLSNKASFTKSIHVIGCGFSKSITNILLISYQEQEISRLLNIPYPYLCLIIIHVQFWYTDW